MGEMPMLHGILTVVSKSAVSILGMILLTAFAVRVGLALHQSTDLDQLPDQREYLSLAQNLREQHSLYFIDPRFDQKLYAYRLPGYPLFLAFKPAALPWILYARIAQSLLDLSTILAVFLSARQLTRSVPIGLAAAGILAINPFFVYFTSLLLSETLFAALLAWGTWFFLRRFWVAGVIFFIGACYVRSTGLLLLPAMAFAAGLNPGETTAYRLSVQLRRGILAALVTTAVMLLCLLPWVWRNHNIVGANVWTTTNRGITLYDGFHAGATGASDQRFVTEMPQLRSMNEVQRSDVLAHLARQWIERHYAAIPALTARKLLRGWSPIPLSREFARPVYRWISVSYALPFDVLCIVGLFSRRLNRRAKLLLTMPALVVTLGQVMTVGSIRYRMPAEATLAVLVGVGVVETVQKVRGIALE
jgi:hypothetical protein